jgi:hypothetical protein
MKLEQNLPSNQCKFISTYITLNNVIFDEFLILIPLLIVFYVLLQLVSRGI